MTSMEKPLEEVLLSVARGYRTVEEIQGDADISTEIRTLYYLEQLEDEELVWKNTSTRPIAWSITRYGRAYIVESDLDGKL